MARGAPQPYPAPAAVSTPLAAELETYASATRDVVRLLEHDAGRLARAAPQVSGWSALHHAAHMTLANELVLRNLVSLSKGSGLLVVSEAAQNPEALALLESGGLPRGRAQAPRMVVPPADIDAPTARGWATQLAADLEASVPAIAAARVQRCFVPHQLLGPLDLAQWVRFGVVHTRHHLAIARDVLDAQERAQPTGSSS